MPPKLRSPCNAVLSQGVPLIHCNAVELNNLFVSFSQIFLIDQRNFKLTEAAACLTELECKLNYFMLIWFNVIFFNVVTAEHGLDVRVAHIGAS